jgi:hypothetical protein
VFFGRSVATTLTVRLGLADSPPGVRGQSAKCPRTVRPGLADDPPGACGQSAWSSAGMLSSLLFEFCFRFGIVLGLLLVLVGPL